MSGESSPTIIGETILVNGNLTGDEDLSVLGRIEGAISLSKTLHVQESGVIKANVQVRNAIISGVVVGNIIATDAVEITEQGRMVGDIKAPRIVIVEGASFRGNVDMGDMEAARPTGPLPTRSELKGTGRHPAPRPALVAAPAQRFKPVERRPEMAKLEGKAENKEPAKAASNPGKHAPAPPKPPPPVISQVKKKVLVKKR